MQQPKKEWQEPQLTVHGNVVTLTRQDKTFGVGDGFTFNGIAIKNVS